METDKFIVGKCPVCGSDVIKTQKGYACTGSLSQNPSCNFFLFSSISNRRFCDAEVSQFLQLKSILLDGFISKEGKSYSSKLTFNPDGTVNMSYVVGQCPQCGGNLSVNSRSVYCSNFNHPQSPCKFTIWRNMGGHDFSLQEIEEIVTSGVVSNAVNTFDNQGCVHQTRFGLNDAKEVVRL